MQDNFAAMIASDVAPIFFGLVDSSPQGGRYLDKGQGGPVRPYAAAGMDDEGKCTAVGSVATAVDEALTSPMFWSFLQLLNRCPELAAGELDQFLEDTFRAEVAQFVVEHCAGLAEHDKASLLMDFESGKRRIALQLRLKTDACTWSGQLGSLAQALAAAAQAPALAMVKMSMVTAAMGRRCHRLLQALPAPKGAAEVAASHPDLEAAAEVVAAAARADQLQVRQQDDGGELSGKQDTGQALQACIAPEAWGGEGTLEIDTACEEHFKLHACLLMSQEHEVGVEVIPHLKPPKDYAALLALIGVKSGKQSRKVQKAAVIDDCGGFDVPAPRRHVPEAGAAKGAKASGRPEGATAADKPAEADAKLRPEKAAKQERGWVDNVKVHLTRGAALSEQYAGKGTGMSVFSKIVKVLGMSGMLDGPNGDDDSNMYMGVSVEIKKNTPRRLTTQWTSS
ncbi:unnamed protein product [Prorocentrum cordatum]|uniref:Uncharacterized protein n=1 Tax=Prorocentrum cordatum TaxID=2364126 RepID=A0ABN9QH11_9DINO|nr:unnamed protein product [Polarella glacialis]